ncbi:MAG: prepilin-type N-terminal cleavage/methylation domain-containing protein [Sedimentisphaerales bacterium]
MRKRTGFNLVELLVAFAIIVIIFAAVVPQFRAIRLSWAGDEARAEIIQNGRVLAEHFTRYLAAAKYIDSVTSSSITFWDNNDIPNQRCYKLAGGYVVFGNVGSEEQLAGPVDSFQISCYSLNDFAHTTTDGNTIRLVRFETHFSNAAVQGTDKTFSSEVFIRTNDQQAAIERGATFEPYGGPTFEFDPAWGQYKALVRIDSTHYLCAYTGSSSSGKAVVLTVNPGNWAITKGNVFQYDTVGTFPALVQIDSTRYLCAYIGNDSKIGYVAVLTVDSNTWSITKGASVAYDPDGYGRYAAFSQIDSTHYLCAYSGKGVIGYAIVFTVSGTTVTAEGVRYQFDTRGLYPALAKIDDSRYLCAYTGTDDMGRAGYAIVLTVSGTIVTPGSSIEFDYWGTVPNLIQIDSSRYLCAYQGTNNLGNVVVLTVSGTNISAGNIYQYDTYGVHPWLSQIDSNRYLCAFQGNPGAFGIVFTVSGTNITSGARYQYDTSCSYPVVSRIDICNHLCAYTGPSTHGRSVVLLNRVKP